MHNVSSTFKVLNVLRIIKELTYKHEAHLESFPVLSLLVGKDWRIFTWGGFSFYIVIWALVKS